MVAKVVGVSAVLFVLIRKTEHNSDGPRAFGAGVVWCLVGRAGFRVSGVMPEAALT